jgi:hypothetical protein
MSQLTRRLLRKHHHETWGIFDCDVGVGSISSGIGTNGKTIWQWSCGFYPGCDKRTQQTSGSCATYDEAKAAFQEAWEQLKPQITPEMRDEWLYEQAWTAWKYAMREAHCKMPTQNTDGRSRCFCGTEITTDSMPDHVRTAHMGTNPPSRA